MSQQKETLEYFRTYATDWQRKAVNEAGEFDLIASRNAAVLATINEMKTCRTMLDVGCGTGQLVIEAARRGMQSRGIDFAQEMILQCEANRSSAGVSADFECVSFFDFEGEPASFDVVSAQGFIEYISPEETKAFLRRANELLSPGGALVVGSRNRLFNAVTMNAFTALERDLQTLPPLTHEAITLQSSESQTDAIAALARLMRNYPQPESHPDTGIGVSVRHQYSPAELIDLLKRLGFETRTIYPIHFHGLPMSAKNEFPEIHNELAKTMQRVAQFDQRIVPFCSSFVIDARKIA